MKAFPILVLLMESVSADGSKYSCPMIDTDLYGNDIDVISGLESWEECGKEVFEGESSPYHKK